MFYQSKVKLGIHLFPYLFSGEGHYLCLIRKPIQNEINIKKKIVVDAYDRIRKLCQVKGGYIYLENNVYYYLSQYVDIAHLHLVRLGLKLGQEEKYGFEYDFALSHYLTSFPLEYSLNDEEVKKYLLGESLPLTKQNKGTILLKYRDNGVSFGKLTSNRINNKYPKGLRKKIEINVD
jgi:NOL1/NOP2/fmu family ribosome biogenesis protein